MGIRNRIKKRFSIQRDNVKTFLFFLGFTSLLWLFIQFSKKYTREIEVTIEYTNTPKDKTLNKTSDLNVKLILNGNGFRLLRYSWNIPTLVVNMNDAIKETDNNYYYNLKDNLTIIKNKLNYRGEILNVEKEQLRINFYTNLKKKIPLISRQYVTYAPGYGSTNGVRIIPDSVTIEGPETIIDTIHNLKVEPIEISELNTDFNKMIGVEMANLTPEIQITPQEIQAEITVSKFTEGSVDVPITLINVPVGEEVKIFPKEIKVVYKISLDKYSTIEFNDFKIIADYNKITEENRVLPLKLIKKPKNVQNVRLQEDQVQFIIVN